MGYPGSTATSPDTPLMTYAPPSCGASNRIIPSGTQCHEKVEIVGRAEGAYAGFHVTGNSNTIRWYLEDHIRDGAGTIQSAPTNKRMTKGQDSQNRCATLRRVPTRFGPLNHSISYISPVHQSLFNVATYGLVH